MPIRHLSPRNLRPRVHVSARSSTAARVYNSPFDAPGIFERCHCAFYAANSLRDVCGGRCVGVVGWRHPRLARCQSLFSLSDASAQSVSPWCCVAGAEPAGRRAPAAGGGGRAGDPLDGRLLARRLRGVPHLGKLLVVAALAALLGLRCVWRTASCPAAGQRSAGTRTGCCGSMRRLPI